MRSLGPLVLCLAAAAGTASAQIVPIARCNAALPCSIPYGLRPADAAAWVPGARIGQGNTAVSVSSGLEGGLEPTLDRPPVSEDPTERAARLFVRRNPNVGTPGPEKTPTPTPGAR